MKKRIKTLTNKGHLTLENGTNWGGEGYIFYLEDILTYFENRIQDEENMMKSY